MITYLKSFKTWEDANSFHNLLANKEEFVVSKVANEGGDIYFLEPIPQMSNEEISKLWLECWDEVEFARAILRKAQE